MQDVPFVPEAGAAVAGQPRPAPGRSNPAPTSGTLRAMHRWKAIGAALVLALAVWLVAPAARAFCGFYVGGADTKLYNNATQVVLLRDGVRTVLSMQNNYQGPPDGFAMVVPVPVVLQKENVKTRPRAVFDRVDQRTAPRLVEYWEQDPCAQESRSFRFGMAKSMSMAAPPTGAAQPAPPMVRVEAEFTVGEYEIVILSADDSMALDAWLRQNQYRIPEGAEPVLRPYVQKGSKFFVAKVDAHKVRFENGMATLSPLRFHYDDDRFELPVRLGLLNSRGVQDLIVQIIARNQRFEAANYENLLIPTNIELNEEAKAAFGAFYVALFDRAVQAAPGAVVTEYAWSAGSCDPCPGPTLAQGDLTTLGGDVLGGRELTPWEATITRLHVRYTKDSLGQDLVFRAAGAIEGGTGATEGSHDAQPARYGQSTFQGRYIVRHPWQGAITCADPHLGRWGGASSQAARDLAFVPREGRTLSALVAESLPSLGIEGTPPAWKTRKVHVPLTAYLHHGTVAVALGIAFGVALLVALRRRPS